MAQIQNREESTIPKKDKYTLIDTTLLSIGGMIGGGIFILNGLLVQKNQQWAPLSWIIGLVIALFISFSYIILSQEFNNNNGGTILYLEKMTNNKNIRRLYSIVVMLGYIVLSTVYAQAFGEYAANYFNKPYLSSLFSIISLFFCLIINYFNEQQFINIENYSVFLKVIIFFFIISLGMIIPNKPGVIKNISSLSQENKVSANSIIIFGLGAFLTYEGFEMISNVTKKMKNKSTNIPLSYFLSIVITGLIYMGTSYVTYKHIGKELNSQNRFFSLLSLIEKYHLSIFGPLLILLLAFFADITAINSTLFVNNRIANQFLEYFEPSSSLKKGLEYEIKLPFFLEKRRITIWVSCILSSVFVFLPLVVTTNLGSMLFLIIFGVIGILGYLLTIQYEKKKKPLLIFNSKTPYILSKIITILSVLLCLVGIIFTSNETRKIVLGKITI